MWKEDSAEPGGDEIVIYEVMAEERDVEWWGKDRKRLERRFKQEKVIVRVHKIQVL